MDLQSLAEFGLEPAAQVLTRAFSDYFVPIPFSAEALLGAARMDGVNLAISRVGLIDGVVVGVALFALRGWSWRLAGMGIVPEARRHGYGRELVERWKIEARVNGARTL
jgi:GNAT superfamily N-acetyltransferase